MNVLITGGAGFIGTHLVNHWRRNHPLDRVTVLDLLTYSGNRAAVDDWAEDTDLTFVHGDICDGHLMEGLVADADLVINLAAESHVDRSIENPSPFLHTNVEGVRVMLEAIRRKGRPGARMVQVSTDEVYGSCFWHPFGETAAMKPSSPYAASKAAADLLCQSYWTTYRTPVVLTRACNHYGPAQFPEKFIPVAIAAALDEKAIPLYGDGLHERDWIFVDDGVRALEMVALTGRLGRAYNIGADQPCSNLDLARLILDLLGRDRTRVRHVADRPGHDRRYAVDSGRISRLGFVPTVKLGEGMKRTVEWYLAHRDWLSERWGTRLLMGAFGR